MKGWIYIASNPSFSELLKIGYSDRDPSQRMEELYSTGVPTPFVPLYIVLVDNAYEVEQKIHAELEFCRDSKSREFFRCEFEKVLDVFDKLKKNSELTINFEQFHASVDRTKSGNQVASKKKSVEKKKRRIVVKPSPGMKKLFGMEIPIDWVVKFNGRGWTVSKNNQEWHVETGEELRSLLLKSDK
jgi:hypothetical protein